MNDAERRQNASASFDLAVTTLREKYRAERLPGETAAQWYRRRALIFSRPGDKCVELVRVEGGVPHVHHLSPVEAVNLAASLFRYAVEAAQ